MGTNSENAMVEPTTVRIVGARAQYLAEYLRTAATTRTAERALMNEAAALITALSSRSAEDRSDTELRAALSEIPKAGLKVEWAAICAGRGCYTTSPRIVLTLPDGSQRFATADELESLLRVAHVAERAARTASPRESHE